MAADFVTNIFYFVLTFSLFCRSVVIGNASVNSTGHHESGKNFPVYPFKVLTDIGIQMCYRECEAYTLCLSVNFNRQMLTCGLNSQKATDNSDLVNADGYVYRDIPGIVSTDYLARYNGLNVIECTHFPCFFPD
jgi:hypothetical protein